MGSWGHSSLYSVSGSRGGNMIVTVERCTNEDEERVLCIFLYIPIIFFCRKATYCGEDIIYLIKYITGGVFVCINKCFLTSSMQPPIFYLISKRTYLAV